MKGYGPDGGAQSPRVAGVSTFLRLPHVTQFHDVDVAIVGLPFDTGLAVRTGARFGPRAVREASLTLHPAYNPAQRVAVFEQLSVVDAGDAHLVAGFTDRSLDSMRDMLEPVHEAGAVPLCIGGDHTVTLAELRAAAAQARPAGPAALRRPHGLPGRGGGPAPPAQHGRAPRRGGGPRRPVALRPPRHARRPRHPGRVRAGAGARLHRRAVGRPRPARHRRGLRRRRGRRRAQGVRHRRRGLRRPRLRAGGRARPRSAGRAPPRRWRSSAAAAGSTSPAPTWSRWCPSSTAAT